MILLKEKAGVGREATIFGDFEGGNDFPFDSGIQGNASPNGLPFSKAAV